MARIDTRPVRDFVAATTAVLREAPTEAQALDRVVLRPGQMGAVSPTIGDIHRVSNACDDQVSIGIPVHGADIGTVSRHVCAAEGAIEPFVSGDANDRLPNSWRAA